MECVFSVINRNEHFWIFRLYIYRDARDPWWNLFFRLMELFRWYCSERKDCSRNQISFVDVFTLKSVYILVHAKPIVEVHAIPIRIEWTITACFEYHQSEWIKNTMAIWWNQIKAFWKVIQVWQWQSGKDEDTCRCWCKIEKPLFPSWNLGWYTYIQLANKHSFISGEILYPINRKIGNT